MPHYFPRSQRIADLLKKEMAVLLVEGIKDPMVAGLVTVMKVNVSRDLRNAKIFFSVLGDEKERNRVMAGLERAKGFIKRELAHRMNLKHMPELTFRLDHSLDAREEIEKLLARTDTAKEV